MRKESLICGLLMLVVAAACGASKEPTAPVEEPSIDEEMVGVEEPDCTPNAELFADEIGPLLDQYCGDCHAAEPDFGASTSILTYENLMQDFEGKRISDLVVERVGTYQMPPETVDVPHIVRDTLVEWASCGEQHPDHASQLKVNREPFVDDMPLPQTAEVLEFTANDFQVGSDVRDLYQCFTFETPNDEEAYISRIEAVIDDSRVLHHLVLIDGEFEGECTAAFGNYYYAWGPGTSAIQFPDGGVVLPPRQKMTVQIHYNNGAGLEDVVDSSGVRLFMEQEADTKYELRGWGAGFPRISIAPGEIAAAEHRCRISQSGKIFIGSPHMHQIGRDFKVDHVPEGGERTSLIDLTGWNFDAQHYYEIGIDVAEGDYLETTCVYDNWTDEPVRGGFASTDEMCFNFVYFSPPGMRCP